ncbi:3-keto-disaccharide hydrolase [Paenibacillus sinopodophylli]|uniref:3-keto-disaccharide hydrolase n=1 Tax=Paenibacillus sinopodophylli TaxID=1837342 RepID=UPI00110CD406|nr:DUF1080 domain-containing protein [Paenibacillus sinopodophylli]
MKALLFKISLLIIVISLSVVTPGSPIRTKTVEAAGTTYYVDATAGNDANTGTSSTNAWRTLPKVNSTIFSPGDRILLKSGSIWNNQYLDLQGSGTSGSPIVVDSYGSGSKPLINFGDTEVEGDGFGVRLKNVSYWEINNLEITSGQHATDRKRSGILVLGEGTGAGAFQHIYIRNNDIHDVFGTNRRTGGINFYARGSNWMPESTWDDVLIENNTVINVADTGIQVMTDAFFNASWTHKFNAFTNVVIRDNYVERIHRDGILVRSSISPLIEYNTTNEIGVSSDVNTSIVSYLDPIYVVAAQWAYATTGAVFQNNEAFNTKVINGDGQAWDFDIDVYNSIYQYNFSHHNEGGALLVMNNTDGNIFRYNISQNDGDAFGTFDLVNNGGNLYVYNNVIYRTNGTYNLLTEGSNTGMAYYSNNIFYNMGSGNYEVGPNVQYDSNLFYGANTGTANDPNKVVGNPLFVNGGGASSFATADAYKLNPASPAINKGKSITGNGGRDFFGNPLYNGIPDIGVHEYTGSVPVPVTLFSDTFEDGNANGWTTSGGSWAVQSDGTLSYVQSAISGEFIAYAGDIAWTDYSVEADIKIISNGGNAGILFRYQDANNFYMLRLNDTSNTVDLYKKKAGTLQLLTSASSPISAGQFIRLKASISGGNITGYVNGTWALTWAGNPAELQTGKIGLRSHSTLASYDNVRVFQ